MGEGEGDKTTLERRGDVDDVSRAGKATAKPAPVLPRALSPSTRKSSFLFVFLLLSFFNLKKMILYDLFLNNLIFLFYH